MLAPIAAPMTRARPSAIRLTSGFNRQLHPLPIDDDRAADQLVEPRGLQRQEHAIERQERDEGERAENSRPAD